MLAFSEKGDFLAMSVEFTMNDVVSVVLGLDDGLAEKILGDGIGGTEEQDCEIAEYVVSVFEQETK